jgi:hypothetical protein
MKSLRRFETIIIGGGQAGLSVSYHLKLEDRDHIVFEQASEAVNAWRNHRWDSFTLNTPNWQSQLQGAGIPGKDPDGFLSRNELLAYFAKYIKQNRLPLWYGTRVFSVKAAGDGYTVETPQVRFKPDLSRTPTRVEWLRQDWLEAVSVEMDFKPGSARKEFKSPGLERSDSAVECCVIQAIGGGRLRSVATGGQR